MFVIGLEESWMHQMGQSVILVRLLVVHGFCNNRVHRQFGLRMLVILALYNNTVRALLELRICVGISDFGISCSKGHVIFARKGILTFSLFWRVATFFFLLIRLLARGIAVNTA